MWQGRLESSRSVEDPVEASCEHCSEFPQAPSRMKNFLTNWVIISVSRRTLLQGVSSGGKAVAVSIWTTAAEMLCRFLSFSPSRNCSHCTRVVWSEILDVWTLNLGKTLFTRSKTAAYSLSWSTGPGVGSTTFHVHHRIPNLSSSVSITFYHPQPWTSQSLSYTAEKAL
jgi:hypothetical protein